MPLIARWTKSTETPIEIRTLLLAHSIVIIQTFSAQLALADLLEPYALRHRAEVPVMRVLAVVAHLAQVAEVVLAYREFLFAFSWVRGERGWGAEVGWGRCCMAVWAFAGWEGAA